MAKRIKKSEKDRPTAAESAEPIGIVISNGTHDAAAPRFSAYVWGPVPEEEISDAMAAVA